MLNLINPYGFDSVILPYRVDVMAWSQASSPNATYNRAQSSSYFGGGVAGLLTGSDADNGDYFDIGGDLVLDAGRYSVTVIYTKASQYGILDVKIDGVSIGTIDLYSAATTNNNVSTFTGVSLAAGPHSLRLAANGKNASSGDYMLAIASITLTRTGA